MRKSFTSYCLIPILLFLFNFLSAQDKGGLESIVVEDIKSRLLFLAADERQGRDTFSNGFEESARYAASLFKEWGIQSFNSEMPYYQPVETEEREILSGSNITIQGKTFDKSNGFMLEPFFVYPGPGQHEVEMVFAGSGYRLVNSGWDDYEGLDIAGKVVVILIDRNDEAWWKAHDTGEKHPRDIRNHRDALFHCWKAGAAGLIKISSNLRTTGPAFIRTRLSLESNNTGFIYGTISGKAATLLFNSEGKQLENHLNPDSPSPFKFRSCLSIDIKGKKTKRLSNNVVGFVPGSDPVLRKEFIIVGAHLDHVGTDSKGNVFNGADDNASGCTAVLELAQAFASLTEKPMRSIVFALWTAEERGSLGSRYFIDSSTLPLGVIKAYINLDMIGRDLTTYSLERVISRFGVSYDKEAANNSEGSKVVIYSSESSPSLFETVKLVNEETEKLTLLHGYTNNRTGGSDHQAFENAGIPIIGFLTGFHTDYHQPTDTADKINYEKTTRITRVIFNTMLILANKSE